MATFCTVDARRSAGSPSPLDRLLIAPQRSAQRDLRQSPAKRSNEPAQPCSTLDGQPKKEVIASRKSRPGNPQPPAMMFNGLTKRYSVLGYEDHMKGEGSVRSLPSSHSQNSHCTATHQPSTLKIMPHVTRPGTSCSRPPTINISPRKSIEPQKMTLCNTPGKTIPGFWGQNSMNAKTHGAWADSQPHTSLAERLASCPVGNSTSRSLGDDASEPCCRTTPASAHPTRKVCASAPHMFNMKRTVESLTTPHDVGLPHTNPSNDELSSYPVILSGSHTSSTHRDLVKTATSECAEVDTQQEPIRTATHGTASCHWRTASPGCTPHSISEFYASVEGPISSVSQSAPMVLSLEDFFQSSKEVIELEISKMSESQLEQLEDSLDQDLQPVNDAPLVSGSS